MEEHSTEPPEEGSMCQPGRDGVMKQNWHSLEK